MKLLTSLITFGLLTLLLTSCVSNPNVGDPPKSEGTLVSNWQTSNGAETIEFRKDGTFNGRLIWDVFKRPRPVTGTYFVDGELISLTPSDLHPMTWKYKISDGDLILTYQQGGELKVDGTMAKFKKLP